MFDDLRQQYETLQYISKTEKLLLINGSIKVVNNEGSVLDPGQLTFYSENSLKKMLTTPGVYLYEKGSYFRRWF